MAALPGKSPDARSPDGALGTTKSNENIAKSPDGLPGAGMVPSNNNVPGGAPAAAPMAAGVPGAPPPPPAAAVARPAGPPPPPKPPSQTAINAMKITISMLCFICIFMLFRPLQHVPQEPPMSSTDYATKIVYGTPDSRKYHVSRAKVCFVVLYTIFELAGFIVIGVAVHTELAVLYIASAGIRAAQLMISLIMYGLFFGDRAQDARHAKAADIELYVKDILPFVFSFIFTFFFIIAIYAISLVLALKVKQSVVFKAQNPEKQVMT